MHKTPSKPRSLRTMAALFALALPAAAALAAGPSTKFSLTGAITTPATFDLAGLQAQTATTQVVNFLAGTTPQTYTYTGTSLWGLISAAGVPVNPVPRNDILNRIVVATGSDDYRAVFALGELSPGFGNRQSIVAYGQTVAGVQQGLGADGFARVTSPGDVRGGRYVSNLVNVDVQTTRSTVAGTGGGRSSSFTVSGDVLRPMSFDLAKLQTLTAVTTTVGSNTYTGVSLWDLLNTTVGIATDPLVRNDVLGMYVVATGSDGYKAAFSLGELSPLFGNQPDIIAYALNGEALTGNGFARIVAPNDVMAGRFVSNLIGLEVFHAAPVPEPGTWALVAAGVAVVLARRPSTLSPSSCR